MIDFFSEVFGPYPFKSAGAIVIDTASLGIDTILVPLETQPRPIYESATFEMVGETVLAHELAH